MRKRTERQKAMERKRSQRYYQRTRARVKNWKATVASAERHLREHSQDLQDTRNAWEILDRMPKKMERPVGRPRIGKKETELEPKQPAPLDECNPWDILDDNMKKRRGE